MGADVASPHDALLRDLCSSWGEPGLDRLVRRALRSALEQRQAQSSGARRATPWPRLAPPQAARDRVRGRRWQSPGPSCCCPASSSASRCGTRWSQAFP